MQKRFIVTSSFQNTDSRPQTPSQIISEPLHYSALTGDIVDEEDKYAKRGLFRRNHYICPSYVCGYVKWPIFYMVFLILFVGVGAFFVYSTQLSNAFPLKSGYDPLYDTELSEQNPQLQLLQREEEQPDHDIQSIKINPIENREETDDSKRVRDINPSISVRSSNTNNQKHQEKGAKLGECPPGSILNNSTNSCVRNFIYPNPVDETMMNLFSNPCEDFYEYACGSYASDIRNSGQDATFTYLKNRNLGILDDIIRNSLPGTKLNLFFNTCLKQPTERSYSDSLITKELVKFVEENLIKRVDFPKILAELSHYDIVVPFSFSMELDPCHAKISVPTFIRDGLTCDNSDPANVGNTNHKSEIEARFLKFRNDKQLKTDGIDRKSIGQQVQSVLAIERSIAQIWTPYQDEQLGVLEYADKMLASNQDLISYGQFKSAMYEFDIEQFLMLFVGDQRYDQTPQYWRFDDLQEIWTFSLEYLVSVSKLFKDERISMDSWRNYFIHCILFSHDSADPFSDPYRYYTYHHGYDPEHALPWKRPSKFIHPSEHLDNENPITRCSQITTAYLPVILDSYFVQQSGLDRIQKMKIEELARSIKDQLVEDLRVHGNTYASQKVKQITILSGTPNNWPPDRSSLKIGDFSHVDNILSIRQFHQELMLDALRLGKPLSPDDLIESPLSIPNAYYQPQLNAAIINAGIISYPMFDSKYHPAARAARLGTVIAHELSHSIDLTGILFDCTGSFNPWITNGAKDDYWTRAQCIIDLYSKKTRYGNQHDGERTVNENIADLIGFRTAYASSFGSSRRGSIQDNIESRREFFLVYAQTWCQGPTDKTSEKEFIRYSVHSTPEMRVNNVVTQQEDFDTLFSCKPQNKCPLF